MRHPFDFDSEDLKYYRGQAHGLPQDLDFEELVSSNEAEAVGGGLTFTTMALGEEGGFYRSPGKADRPGKPRCQPVKPIDPPVFTTQALGEEGGFYPPPEVTTYALGEEGGSGPEPPQVTTLAIGEEGGEMPFL